MDFDETRLYFSHQQLQQQRDGNEGTNQNEESGNPQDFEEPITTGEEDTQVDLNAVRRHFREFIRNYRLGLHRYIYRERLLRMHRRLTATTRNNTNHGNPDSMNDDGSNAVNNHDEKKNRINNAKLVVDLAHIGEYDSGLLGFLMNQPSNIIPALEMAASDALKTLLYDMNPTTAATNNSEGMDNMGMDDLNDENNMNNPNGIDADQSNNNNTAKQNVDLLVDGLHIQILLQGNIKSTPLRKIKSEHMNKLIKCPGIVISTQPVRSRAVQLFLRCPRCDDEQILYANGSTTRLNGQSTGNSMITSGTAGPFSSIMLPANCHGAEPQECGKHPYNILPDQSLFIDQQTLKLQEAPESVPTGEMPRAVLLALERSLVDVAPPGTRVSVLCVPTIMNSKSDIKSIYLRVVGLTKDSSHKDRATNFTPAEEEAFHALSKRSDIYDILARSIAPSIKGSYTVDIKCALLCLLFGGSRKRLPDGVRLRGDINVLLLGDPSTAKSQFLKFASKVAPIGIYTSGKGSSAAGLTASVVRDSKREFYLEGGAMVLADGGLVAIDEFDKMRPNDRVAIHEAMEQQTISVAKAGITTVLNSRCSVLAAANPVFGRYDDFKSTSDNIDLMSTILSRFDLIFLVRDIREEDRDRMICQHVMGVHMNNSGGSGGAGGSGGNGGLFQNTANLTGSLAFLNGGDENGNTQENSPSNPIQNDDSIAENVMRVANTGLGELDIPSMKKYVQYCRARCEPRLTEEAGEVLISSYVKIRDDVRKQSIQGNGNSSSDQATIPITVRQLEALVRLSESLAKMRLDDEVRSDDITEALRLFKVSTMAANAADQSLASQGPSYGRQSNDGLTGPQQRQYEELVRTEEFLRIRLSIGSMLNKQKLVEEAAGQGYNALIVNKAISIMTQRGEILERNQGRLLKRLK